MLARWTAHVGISLTQSAILALALWSWAAFCTCAIAKVISRDGYLSVPRRGLVLSAISSAMLVGLATVMLCFYPRTDLLGIHNFSLSPPYTWWLWAAILICEPAVSAGKMIRYRPLLLDEATYNGKPVQVEPRWAEILEQLVDVIADGSSYVGRSRS